MFISVGLAGSRKVSYWVGYIYPVQKRFLGIDRLFRRVEMYETERMDRIIPIVKAFSDATIRSCVGGWRLCLRICG